MKSAQAIRAGLLVAATSLFCSAHSLEAAEPNENAVVHWNAIASTAFLPGDPTQGIDPLTQSRIFSMMHAAIHDALNAIDPQYSVYTPGLSSARGASPEAAVAAAAHDLLIVAAPTQKGMLDAAYQSALSKLPEGSAKRRGVQLGKRAAVLILQRRADDGVQEAFATPYIPLDLPGDYAFTPPFDVPPLGPLAFAPGYGDVTPFGIKVPEHGLPGPQSLMSVEYALDFAYAKAVGESESQFRTAEQSEIADFWYEDTPIGWNRIARLVLNEEQVGLWRSARVLALTNFAMADAYIAGFAMKYDFRFWRPVTAIRAAAHDSNPLTSADSDWLPYRITPPVPDYPSTHTVGGSAAAAVLSSFFGIDYRFSTTSTTAPGVTRTFHGFDHAALENGASRVYAGIHFGHAVADGHRQGDGIGRAIARLLARRN
jgi:membrane-associated phospholipid phosphatase